MAEDGGAMPAMGKSGGGGAIASGITPVEQRDDASRKSTNSRPSRIDMPDKFEVADFASPVGAKTPNYFSRKNTSIDMEDYFTGPRDIQKHSKWPYIFQMHGSIFPKLIIPLVMIGCWATAITVISTFVFELRVAPILLTVLGFVVALGLSFRSSTAYERYAEGRRYWGTLILATQTLARVFWVHARDVDSVPKNKMMLRRISCLNLLLAYAVALKHKLRYEPYTGYEDLQHLVAHLNSFAQAATAADPKASRLPKKTFYKEMGEYLGVSFAESNPRKAIKKSVSPLGNLPLEILSHLSMMVDGLCVNGQLPVPMHQTMAYNNLTLLNDVMTGTERVLTTPLPIAYNIAINQITWLYILLLPFQLFKDLRWITIPATIAASYIILGILFIGKEIENPFGTDVNDLPLEMYCEQIAHELDVTAATDIRREDPWSFVESGANLPMYPVSMAPFTIWAERSEDKIASAIRSKPTVLFESRKRTSEDLKREEALRHRRRGHKATGGNEAAASPVQTREVRGDDQV